MVDVDTFLTTLYVITDDFCQGFTHPRGGLAPMPPFVKGRSLPWPSSPGGLDSLANGTSTALLAATLERHSPPCPTAPSSIGWCASMPRTSRRWLCI